MNKIINFDKGGIQVFFSDGFYTGSNIIGNPSAEDWEKINSIKDLLISITNVKLQGPGY
jgi:hypothetical protein